MAERRDHVFRPAVAFLATAASCLAVPFTSQASDGQVAPDEAGFVSLFNGRDLTGWQVVNGPADAFVATDGLLKATGKAHSPTWLRSDKIHENFILRFDYNPPDYSEIALVLHAPLHGRISRVGQAVYICDDTAHGMKMIPSGSILDGRRSIRGIVHNYDEWNIAEAAMDWPVLRVAINGRKVQEVDFSSDPEFRYRLRSGYLGFLSMGGSMSFRNLRIKELPSKERWRDLFNGKDLDGWRTEGPVTWEVRDGAIFASNGTGYLVTKDEFRDFELFTYVRSSPYANGGIFFRWKSLKPPDRGNEIQIYNEAESSNPTGSLYGLCRANTLTVRDNEWFPMQIHVKDKKVVVRVNGEQVVDADCLEVVRPGAISLQMHAKQHHVEFKGVRIKDAE